MLHCTIKGIVYSLIIYYQMDGSDPTLRPETTVTPKTRERKRICEADNGGHVVLVGYFAVFSSLTDVIDHRMSLIIDRKKLNVVVSLLLDSARKTAIILNSVGTDNDLSARTSRNRIVVGRVSHTTNGLFSIEEIKTSHV